MTDKQTRANRKKKMSKKKIALFTFLILLIMAALAVGYYYNEFNKVVDKMNTNTNTTEVPVSEKLPHIDPFSVLLLGIDERDNDTGRSDTMIVVTVNPDDGSMKMLSIPRDSRVEIIGNGTTEKINHAYARGGIPMAIDTVENVLDIPIDFYVSVNMEGFLSLVDILGDIEVNNDMDLVYRDYTFPKGNIHLNGEEALIFSRIRYEDPRGDFGRQLRQKQLIEALLGKAKNPSILLKMDDVMKVMGENVSMNFSQSQILNLQKLYSKLDKNIDQIQFEQGEGTRIDGYWYYLFNDEELEMVQDELKQHLELTDSESPVTPN